MTASDDQSRSVSDHDDPIWRQVVMLSPLAFFHGDETGRFVAVNPAAIQLTGYEESELLTLRMDDLFPPEVLAREPLRYDLLESGEAIRKERQLVRKDGGRVWVDMHSRKLPAGGYISFMQDISERKAAEAEYRDLVERAGVAILIDDEQGGFRYCNPRFAELFGLTLEEVRSRSIATLVHPEDVDRVMGYHVDRLAGRPAPDRYEFRGLRADGTVLHLEVSAMAIREGDRIIGTRSYIWDVTQRKKLEAALRNSERKYRELFDKTDDAILIIENNRFVDCNEATVRMLRYRSKEELLNTHPSELSPPYQPDGRLSFEKAEEMMRIAMEKGSHRFEWEHKRADGEVFPVEVLLTAVSIEENKKVLHTVWRDITERKMAEAQLLQVQKMDSIGQLAGGVAHDFNNMLGGIMGYASLLLEDETHPDRRNALKGILQAAERAADLTRKLLAFGRKGKHRVVAVSLNQVADEVLELLGRSLDKRIVLDRRFDPHLPFVDADPGQMHQVVMNLCVNAGHAMPSGGTLTVETGAVQVPDEGDPAWPELKPGRYVMLSVTDTGVGMSEEVRRRAFEPFFSTREDGHIKGTGLGLSTVYGIVRNHGGSVVIQSEPGAGTTVEIRLPEGERQPEPEQQETRRKLSSTGCVLVVDDEDVIREMAAEMLRSNGYHVITARDGLEAVDIFRNRRQEIDGVVLDLKMPRMDGKETFRHLQAIHPEVRVILSTGFGLNEEAQQVLDAGARGLVSKPYRMEELLSAVARLLR